MQPGDASRCFRVRAQCGRTAREPNAALPVPRRHAEVDGTQSDERLRHRWQYVPEPADLSDNLNVRRQISSDGAAEVRIHRREASDAETTESLYRGVRLLG